MWHCWRHQTFLGGCPPNIHCSRANLCPLWLSVVVAFIFSLERERECVYTLKAELYWECRCVEEFYNECRCVCWNHINSCIFCWVVFYFAQKWLMKIVDTDLAPVLMTHFSRELRWCHQLRIHFIKGQNQILFCVIDFFVGGRLIIPKPLLCMCINQKENFGRDFIWSVVC